jgi:hypothetical protein
MDHSHKARRMRTIAPALNNLLLRHSCNRRGNPIGLFQKVLRELIETCIHAEHALTSEVFDLHILAGSRRLAGARQWQAKTSACRPFRRDMHTDRVTTCVACGILHTLLSLTNTFCLGGWLRICADACRRSNRRSLTIIPIIRRDIAC